MKPKVLIAAASLLALQVHVYAGTGVPPACAKGAFTDECLDFGVAAQEALTRYRLDHDQDVGSGAPIAHRSEAQKAEIWRLTKAYWKEERENVVLKHRQLCPGN